MTARTDSVTDDFAEDSPPQGALGVERCVDVIREMILGGEVMPGEKVHQKDLAEQLQVSRVPIREALARLHAEGLLTHKPNAGFTVARFSSEALSEMYSMRRLLETEILSTVDFDAIDADRLEAINVELRALEPREQPTLYQKLNADFHFGVFSASPLELFCQEVLRLWNMSAYYRSLYLFVADDTTHLCDEHDGIIAAIRARDVQRLIEASDEHRARTQRVEARLPKRGNARFTGV